MEYNGCGLVAASGAVAELGYENSDFGVCFETIAEYAIDRSNFEEDRFAYSPNVGIAPSAYAQVVENIVESGGLGIAGEVEAVDWLNPEDSQLAVEILRQALWRGDEVVVDFLAMFKRPISEGTQPFGGNPNYVENPSTFAHFTRVVGVSEDGQTIYLAETLKHNGTEWSTDWSTPWNSEEISKAVEVPIEEFLKAWNNSEVRASSNYGSDLGDYNIEEVNYWMLIISPPEKNLDWMQAFTGTN